MTVTLNLPPDVEHAFLVEAQAKGVSLDEFLSEMILSQSELAAGLSRADPSFAARLEYKEGVPVLRSGRPLGISLVNETLASIRRERAFVK